jgi:hypothetical protein
MTRPYPHSSNQQLLLVLVGHQDQVKPRIYDMIEASSLAHSTNHIVVHTSMIIYIYLHMPIYVLVRSHLRMYYRFHCIHTTNNGDLYAV